jgi:hypothetical protein
MGLVTVISSGSVRRGCDASSTITLTLSASTVSTVMRTVWATDHDMELLAIRDAYDQPVN